MNRRIVRLSSLVGSSGLLGGILLAIMNGTVAPGKLILLPYCLLMGFILFTTWNEGVPSFRGRFVVALSTFVLSSLVLYASIAVSPVAASVSVLGHAWRMLFLVGVGSLIALPIARISENRSMAPAP